jgi:hypothetical protein
MSGGVCLVITTMASTHGTCKQERRASLTESLRPAYGLG